MTVLARRSGATALVTVLVGALAAGCGSSSHSTTQSHTTAASAVTSVSWDLPEGEPGSLDPALSGTSSSTEPLVEHVRGADPLLRLRPARAVAGLLLQAGEPQDAGVHDPIRRQVLGRSAADRRGRRLQPLATAEPAPWGHVDRPMVHRRRVDQADRHKSGHGATSRRPTLCSSRSCRRPPARSARPPT